MNGFRDSQWMSSGEWNAVPASAATGQSRAPWLLALLVLAFVLHAAMVPLSGAGLHVDEAQYWWWSRELQWGYYSKPPVIAVLIKLSTALFGDGLLGVRLLCMLCWCGAVAVVYRLGSDMVNTTVGFWAAALLLASPLFVMGGLFATTDAPLMLCWALALWCLWLAVEGDRPWFWPLWAVAMGTGVLSKYTMLALVPGALWWAWHRRGWRGLAAAMAATLGALALASPHLAWNHLNGWPTLQHTLSSTDASTAGSSQAALRMAELVIAQLALLGPAAWALALFSNVRERPAQARSPSGQAAAEAFLAMGIVVLLAAGLLQALRGRIEVNWLAPMHLSAALLMALRTAPAARHRRAWQRWRVALSLQAALVAALLMLPAAWAAMRPQTFVPPFLDAWARMRAWDAAFEQLAVHAQAHPDAWLLSDSRQVLAHGSYAWRRFGLRPAAFNRDDVVRHHFAMRCPWHLASQSGRPYLLVTEGPAPADAAAAFDRLTPLAVASVERSAGRHVELHLALGQLKPTTTALIENPCP